MAETPKTIAVPNPARSKPLPMKVLHEVSPRASLLQLWFDQHVTLDSILAASEEDTSEVRLKNYRNLVSRVVEVFGDPVRASSWLSGANDDFGGKTPLDVAREDEYRSIQLEPVLTKLEHGIYF